VILQFVLVGLTAIAALAGPAWSGGLRFATSAVGILLLGAGIVMAVRGVLDLGRALTPLPYPREDSELVVRGAYRLVRHPVYSGVIMGAFGWGLLTASPVALALAVVIVIFFDLKSRREEAWLSQHHPGYEAYRRRTRRLIPWIY
jgi:protein-S-isoprenylcysteine O-methyltransferase Ste14